MFFIMNTALNYFLETNTSRIKNVTEMDILYVCVSRNNIILAQLATGDGDYDVSVNRILSKTHLKDHRIRLDTDNSHFFILHQSNGINVILCSSQSPDSSEAFNILEQIYSTFISKFTNRWISAKSYELQNEFSNDLKNYVDQYSQKSKLQSIKENIEEAQNSMMNSLEESIVRGQHIADLEKRTESLDEHANMFNRSAYKLKVKLMFEKYIWYIIGIVILVILIILFILYMSDVI